MIRHDTFNNMGITALIRSKMNQALIPFDTHPAGKKTIWEIGGKCGVQPTDGEG